MIVIHCSDFFVNSSSQWKKKVNEEETDFGFNVVPLVNILYTLDQRGMERLFSIENQFNYVRIMKKMYHVDVTKVIVRARIKMSSNVVNL